MEQLNLILKIQSAYNQFTKAERKVADYCLAHREEVLFLSITDLSEACGVGEASVFRFCRTLGLGGYQEFKMQMSLCQNLAGLEERLSGREKDPEENRKTLAKRVLENHQQAVDETAQLLDENELEHFLDLLDTAERIYFFGISDSLLAAQEARSKFLRLTDRAVCVEDPHLMAVTSTMMHPEDLLVMISYSGATRDVIRIAGLAKQAGAHVGALTHYRKSPLTDYADTVLLCGGQEGPLDRGSLAAKAGMLYLIDLLYQGFYERNEEVCRKKKEKAIASVVDKTF